MKLTEQIRTLAPTYGSIPFWSWNDKLEENELREQIRTMKSLGMNGFFMHARGGLETEYLSDDWFHCVEVCVDEAKKLGMEAWAYDENGWPSGFAGGALLHDKRNFALSIEHRDGPFPPSPASPDDDEIIAVYRKNPDGSFTHVTEDVGDEEYLILYRRYDSSYVDTLNGEVTDLFLEATHAEYKRRLDPADFGTAMPGFFTDEPQYYRWGHPYSNTLPREFEAAYGRDIYEKLPALFYDFDGADKFRYDYYYLIHRLFINNFIKKIHGWCQSNGAAITGHAVEESSLGGQMMCAGGMMPFYEYETIPGIDYLGRGLSDDIAFKQLGSACAQLGKKKALSEMFACCGWDVSPIELKKIAEIQYAGGVNLMCQHLYPYSERGQRKRDYPLHYSAHNPWQRDMAALDRYFSNLGAALSLGEEYAPVLVIHPIHGAYCKYKKDDGGSLGEIESKFFELSRALGSRFIPYHYGDEWMMSRMASVEGNRIRVGRCVYDAVLVPFTYSLDESTAALLKTFRENGGRIVLFDGIPSYLDGEPADGRLDFLTDAEPFDALLSFRDAVILRGGKEPAGIRKMSRILPDGGRMVFLTNASDGALRQVSVRLPEGAWAELDPDTLAVKPICREEKDGSTLVTLDFAEAEAHLLLCTDDTAEIGTSPAPTSPDAFIPIPRTVKLAAHPVNMMTLDTAERSDDGITYDAPLSVMGIKDNLLRERKNGVVYLRFSFELGYRPATLKAVLEPMYQRVTVNGTEVVPDKADWWFDKSFASAEISPLVHEGRNEIVVEVNHYQRDYVYYVLYGGVSESLRNCLVFDTEVEPMYLIGDFSVCCNGVFTDGPRHSTLYDGSFRLVKQPDVVPAADVVRGGFPFYGGELAVSFDYSWSAGKPTVLRLDGRFATAAVTVNGKSAGKMLFNRELDLAPLLEDGDNEIGVVLCNSMRNAMGPHHRHDPEPYGVGPGTFSFENEWKGRECRGYVSRYAFVKYGLKR